MIWTGLTGGIASGKSAAKKLIEGLGFPVIDADQISHQQSEVSSVGYRQIVSHFGQEILKPDLSLDRTKLAKIIFTDQSQKVVLENILHPLIQAEVQRQKSNYMLSGAKLCFYDVPLLFEKKLQNQFDVVLLIWCDYKTQIQRLMKRNSLSEDEAKIRIKNQMKLNEKVKLANYCIDNSSDIEDLSRQLNHFILNILSLQHLR
jgi:dephospho-CoA kinase